MRRQLLFVFLFIIGNIPLAAQNIVGIDVSHWQGSINWQQVYAAGKTFAWAKATEGVTFDDGTFVTNMTNGTSAGVVMGAYHFGRPDNNSAVSDANHFLSVASSYIGPGHLQPALDIEDPYASALTTSALSTWIQQWMTTVQNATGVVPILYTTGNYASNLNSSLAVYKLWIANYPTSQTSSPTNIGIWPTWAFKQYSRTETVSGISGDVDLDVFNGTTADFNNLIGGTSCTDNFETNDNCATATLVFASPLGIGSSNYTLNANIGYAGDQDWYKINLAACGTLTVTLSNLPYNYDVEMYGVGAACTSNYLGGSTNSGTTNEQIVYTNATSSPTTIFVKVYPYVSTTYTTASCYSLQFQWSGTSCCITPATQASNIVFTPSTTSMGLSWTNGNGSRRVVKINTTNSFAAPTNGTDPSANAVYSGSGQQVVYNNSGNAVTVTGLIAGTNYCFRIYEANCTGSSSQYNTSSAGNNPLCQNTTISCSSPSTQASNIVFTPSTTSMNLIWTNGNGSKRVVKINTTNNFTTPANGTDPTANTVYSGSGEQVVYNGNSNGINVTGLTAGANYCFRIYEANCSGTSSQYNTTSATNNPACQSTSTSCVAPTVQATNITFSNINANSITVTWTNGNGGRRVVKANNGNSFTAPVNGTDPTANNVYSGSGQQVVYNGSSNTVTVTGLTAGNNYCFVVYEANCSGASSVYNVSGSNNVACQTITTGCSAPTLQANINSAAPTSNQITVNLTPGNGNRRVLKMNTTNSFNNPVNGADPAGNSIYSGSGEQVVFNGNGTNVIVSGLSSTANYCFRVYEANCSGTSSAYDLLNLTTVCQVTATPTDIPNINGVEDFKIIPNPNNGIFIVKMKFNTSKNVAFRLMNVLGQVVYQSEVYHLSGVQSKEINATRFANGVYLLETKINNETFTRKIIINKN
jgi:GH25 family lysozyme M1 (1,4-beta-N-acetylmuramidase)